MRRSPRSRCSSVSRRSWMTHAEGRGGNQPWLHDSYGVQLNEFWAPWAEIHPDAARDHGVGEGELIWLESTTGKIAVKARLFEGAMHDRLCGVVSRSAVRVRIYGVDT